MEKAVGAEVSVTPTDVQYCTKGCSYTITGGTFTDNSTTGTNYTTGALPKKIKGETSASTGTGTTYTLTLHNPAGDDVENCSFKVKYDDATPVCNCKSTCGTGCEDRIRTRTIDNTQYTGCLFFTSISKLNFNSYKLNGTNKSGQLCWDNPTECAEKLSSITKIDGGYYVYVNGQTGYITITGGTNPCSNEPEKIDITYSGERIDNGSVVVGSLASRCPKVKFDCPWNNQNLGCSVKINSGTPFTGSFNSSNNNMTKPSVNDVLTVTGSARIFCAD